VKSIPGKWFRHCSCLRFNVGGQQHYLTAEHEVVTPYDSHCALLGVLDAIIGDEVMAHARAKEDLKTARNEADAKITGLLYSITTMKQLVELWPEGKEFYQDSLSIDNKTGAVAIRFDDMNARLGLKTTRAA